MNDGSIERDKDKFTKGEERETGGRGDKGRGERGYGQSEMCQETSGEKRVDRRGKRE